MKTTILLFTLLPITISGYVSTHIQKQKWLEEMTESICSTKLGTLSHEMLEYAPELMNAWTHLDSTDCVLRAESLVKRVVDERRAGNHEATMTRAEYNCLLEGWARSGAGPAAAARCEQIVAEMQEHSDILPDLSSFKAILMSWRQSAKCTDAPARAQQALEWMIKLYTSGQNQDACPDADCFDIVMQLWAQSRRRDAPEKAEQLLYAMEALYEATQRPKLQPRTTSFNAVLTSWAKSDKPHALKRVRDVLTFLEMLSEKDGGTAPDRASYTTAIAALTRKIGCDAASAETMLNHVEEKFLEDHNGEIQPSTIMYNLVLGGWSKANRSGSFGKARALLTRQVELYKETNMESIKPDVYGFTAVIGTCAMETQRRAAAFQTALATFQHLRHSPMFGEPNHVTYGSMLKCCAKLLPASDPMRQKWVKKIWNMCVRNGCVGDMVLSRLREASCGPLYKELMQGHNKRDLPREWSRNVRETEQIRRKRSHYRRRSAEV